MTQTYSAEEFRTAAEGFRGTALVPWKNIAPQIEAALRIAAQATVAFKAGATAEEAHDALGRLRELIRGPAAPTEDIETIPDPYPQSGLSEGPA